MNYQVFESHLRQPSLHSQRSKVSLRRNPCDSRVPRRKTLQPNTSNIYQRLGSYTYPRFFPKRFNNEFITYYALFNIFLFCHQQIFQEISNHLYQLKFAYILSKLFPGMSIFKRDVAASLKNAESAFKLFDMERDQSK